MKCLQLLRLAPSSLVGAELTTPCHANGTLPTILAAATNSPSPSQRRLIASSRGLALPTSLAAATSGEGGGGGGFVAQSRGPGVGLLVVAANPPSPQQAENWPRGFHQSQKTVSSALQAYRFCPMAAEKKRKDGVNLMRSQSIIPACPGLWLQLNWPSSKGKG